MENRLERRKYIRLSSVFPVALQFFLAGQPYPRLYQGFTRDVSPDGLCIEVSDLDTKIEGYLHNLHIIKLQLIINIPLSSKPTKATAKIIWIESTVNTFPRRYLIGVNYEDIDQKARRQIFSYAKRVRNFPRYITACIITLLAITSLSLIQDFEVRYKNRLLIDKAVELAKRYSQLEKKIYQANRKEEELRKELAQGVARQRQLEMQLSELKRTIEQTKKFQEQKLADLLREKERLEQALSRVQLEKSSLEDDLSSLIKEKASLTTDLALIQNESQGLKQSTLQNMYRWIKNHQIHSTGLVTSFEGDRFLKDWAFTYDQSLSAQVFTLFGDYERARKIFDFYKFKAEKVDGGFVNAYEVSSGNVTEYIVHSGPNIWLAIAILQYINRTKDTRYLDLALSIADWVIAIQNQDEEYGIRGGPKINWFSTEHNLDAYALFNMLEAVTGYERYRIASQRTLRWLKTHAYSSQAPPINRGKGDATIATDTFSWAICSIGPETLLKEGMNPEQIIEYAQNNCAVTVQYKRPDGEIVEVSGFDFSKYTHLPRRGVVSTEWTAQMVVAYQVMADYFSKRNSFAKAEIYRQKANFYINELSKMLISSPSKIGQGEGCLPYASAAFVDTGHGWRTPKGDRTGSLAATAYTIFASRNYNPLLF